MKVRNSLALTTRIACLWMGFAAHLAVAQEKTKEAPVAKADATNPRFKPDSFWYTPIAKNVALHPNSKALVAAFIRQKALGNKGKDNIVGINTESFASPVYVADANTPKIKVHVDRCPEMNGADFDGLQKQFNAVPMPAAAQPACGDDSEMTIYQRSSDTLWEFWRARKTANGEWHACWGGKMTGVSNWSGIWPQRFGATATGLPFAGGQITPEELRASEIKHVMGIALVQADKRYCWPAHWSDGKGCDCEPCIPEGARFRLDPDVCVDQLNMHPVGKMIAKAAQKYGFVVWDVAGTTSLRAKNPKSYTQIGLQDPYKQLLQGDEQYTALNGFPWDKLQFLPFEHLSGGDAPGSEAERKSKEAKVDRLLHRLISPDGPGAAVLVIQNHKIMYKNGYGLARLGAKPPMSITPTTIFRLASVSKQFTGMAIAMLIEEHKLCLDDRLTKFFPDQTANEIRLRHLLYHTSGLPYYGTLFRERGMIDGTFEYRSAAWPPSGFEPTNADVLRILRGQTLLHYPPGDVTEYSNTGYNVLGSIIEKVSKKCYGQFLKERIFDKLGMKNTFVAGNPDRKLCNLAYSYDFSSAARCEDIDYSPLNRTYGEDGVYTTLEDMFLWDQALLSSADRLPKAKCLVSDDTLDLIFRPGTLNNGASTGYAFGWLTGDTYVDHAGGWLGFQTYIRRYFNGRLTIVVLANYANLEVVTIADGIDAIYSSPGNEGSLPRISPAVRSGKRSDMLPTIKR
jgi:CubicO group peptidase (beta-lactamase class C family)